MPAHALVRLAAALVISSVALTASDDPKPRIIDLTGNDQMQFSVTALTARPGEVITVRLRSIGKMPKIAMAHNFVLLAAGTDATAFANAAATSPTTGYIPPSMKAKVLAHTALAGAGETVQVTFKVPAKPGKYTYLCSFPGHFVAGMKGVLTVK